MYKCKSRFAILITVSLVISLIFGGCSEKAVNNDDLKEGESVNIKIFSTLGFDRENPSSKLGQSLTWLEYAENVNNIKLVFETVPGTSYRERLQLMLASGDYPDLIHFGSATDNEFIQAVDNGVVAPINKYLEEAPNIENYTSNISLDAMRIHQDENIYGIPISTLIRSDGFVVRKDWLDNVDLTIPSDGYVTLDEFTEILKRFSNNDPDKNGKKDTYGLSAGLDNEKNLFPPIVNPFGYSGWQKASGKYEYIDPMYDNESDTFKRILEYNAMIFKRGLVDPDAPISSSGNTRFMKGIAGVISTFAGHYYWRLRDIKKVNPNATIGYIKGIKDNEGNILNSAGFSTGYYGLWAITSNNKHPKAAIRFFNWLLSDDGWDTMINGMEAISYKVENGEKKYIEGGQMPFSKNFLRRSDGIDYFLPIQDADAKPYIDVMRGNIKESMQNVVVSLDRGYRPPSSSNPALMDAKKDLNMAISKILVGEMPVSEYNKVLDSWYKAGGEQYIKEMNIYIKKMQGE